MKAEAGRLARFGIEFERHHRHRPAERGRVHRHGHQRRHRRDCTGQRLRGYHLRRPAPQPGSGEYQSLNIYLSNMDAMDTTGTALYDTLSRAVRMAPRRRRRRAHRRWLGGIAAEWPPMHGAGQAGPWAP